MSTKVRIKKDKVIKALQDTLKEKQDYPEVYKKAQAKYEKDTEALCKKLYTQLKTKPSELSINNYRDAKLVVEFSIPKGTEIPEAPQHYAEWQLNQEIKEIKQAIRTLEMCEDDEVTSTLLKTFSQWL